MGGARSRPTESNSVRSCCLGLYGANQQDNGVQGKLGMALIWMRSVQTLHPMASSPLPKRTLLDFRFVSKRSPEL